jgi:hypothetical protein
MIMGVRRVPRGMRTNPARVRPLSGPWGSGQKRPGGLVGEGWLTGSPQRPGWIPPDGRRVWLCPRGRALRLPLVRPLMSPSTEDPWKNEL